MRQFAARGGYTFPPHLVGASHLCGTRSPCEPCYTATDIVAIVGRVIGDSSGMPYSGEQMGCAELCRVPAATRSQWQRWGAGSVRTLLLLLLITVAAGLALQPAGSAHAAAADTAYQKGLAAAGSGHYAEAAGDFEQAILLKHHDPATFYQLGLAYSQLKRWNDAVWALATARTDEIFSAEEPNLAKALDTASNAGGANVGPPAVLRDASMSSAKADLPLIAVQEARAAFQALQSSASSVSPEFNRQITAANSGALSDTARSLNENNTTITKFAFIGAIPRPFTTLSDYAHDLFIHLGLQRAVVVVVTPDTAAAYSDRLDAASAQRIATTQQGKTPADPITTATAIATAVTHQADDRDAANSRRSLLIGGGVIALILLALAAAVIRIGRRSQQSGTRIGGTRISRP